MSATTTTPSTPSQSPVTVGRWMRAADTAYRFMRREFRGEVHYAPYHSTRPYGPEARVEVSR